MTNRASEQFKEGVNGIYYVGDAFQEKFGSMTFERSTAQTSVTTLERDMTDKEILSEFHPGECTLGDLLKLLVGHKSGLYILYIRDDSGTLWAVDAFWLAVSGWYVNAYRPSGRYRWRAGGQVLSRESDPRTLEPLVSAEALKKGGRVEIRDGKVYKAKSPKICKSCKQEIIEE